MVSWQELPAGVREKLKRKLSPDQLRDYMEHREKAMDRHVEKIVEDIERNEHAAEIAFELNQEKIKEELSEQGLDQVVDVPSGLHEKLPGLRQAFSEGRFRIEADMPSREQTNLSVTVDLPEGNVAESLPVKLQLQQTLLAHARGNSP